jgi:protein gp37
MGDKSEIEWTEATWNPIRGCSRKSPGCGGPGDHGGCYAEGIAARFSGPGQPYEGIAEMRGGKPRWTGKLAFIEPSLTLPLRWKKPRQIFVNSMSDLFHENVPYEWIDKIFAVMALCPQHTFQVLTKRSARMRGYLSAARTHPVHGRRSEIGSW